MEITLQREKSTEKSTIGDLQIKEIGFRCWILEDPVRPQKIKEKTAIPAGRYQIKRTWSPRFNRMMLEVVNVPNYQGIRIHSGNDADDTEGCLLPAFTRKDKDFVMLSKKATEILTDIIDERLDNKEEVFISIENYKELV